MGFRIGYLLAQTEVETATAAFGLTTGAALDAPPFGDDLWATHLVKTGWTVIWAEDELFFYEQPKCVAALSKHAPVISCVVNETVMASTAMGWRDGRLTWSVHHQGDAEDTSNLDAKGALPPLLDDLKARAVANADDEIDEYYSFFEVPLDLAAMETGFRHDRVLSSAEAPTYSTLTASAAAKPGFFARLLGKG